MIVRNKKLTKIVASLLFLLITVYFLIQWRVKYMVEDFIQQKIPQNMVFTYTNLDVNILKGNIDFDKVSVEIQNKDTLQTHTLFTSENLQVNGIGYWQMYFNSTLDVKAIVLKKPVISYYPDKHIQSKKDYSKRTTNHIKNIKVHKFNIEQGSAFVIKADTVYASVSSYNLTVLESEFNLHSITNDVSFTYNNYQLDVNNLFLDKGKYETLKIKQLYTEGKTFYIENLSFQSKYDKKELSKHLSKERDYINLSIPKIILKTFDFNINEDPFGIVISSVEIHQPHLELYRDKLLPDDLNVKSLYSKALRDATYGINIGKVKITNSYISYAEEVDDEHKAGMIFFDNVNATLSPISNHKNAKKTMIDIQSKLMGQAPLELNWSFDVNNKFDVFTVSGSLRNLEAEIMNPFFKSNLNSIAEGELEQMYFTFYGDAIKSKGEIKMKYDDFKFMIMQENELKVNKIFTAIVNIFISDGSKTDASGFRYGTIEVEREVSKSFFNYLWINVKDGIVSTLTGDGKKEE